MMIALAHLSLQPKTPNTCHLRVNEPSAAKSTTSLKNVSMRCQQAPDEIINGSKKCTKNSSPCTTRFCPCTTRRHFMEAFGAAFLPIYPSLAIESLPNDPATMLNRVHPPRPDCYEEFYASALDKTMKSYEAEIAGYKSQLFGNLRGKAKNILEIGIGTGPNLKYYANNSDVCVFGIDPNRKMEKYALAAARAAGIPSANFKFMQAVGEALPINDASIDAVIGTLVLCSVKDVDLTLQEIRRVLKPGGIYLFVEHVAAEDGTILNFVQGVLDPLQQTVADGCHLTRKTGNSIAKTGFSEVDIHKILEAGGIFIGLGLRKIAKTGSLCCVAARPHGSNATSREWSMGPHEPYWRTNTSFSPPPLDFRFQSEAMSFGSHDGIQLYGSSASSNSRESRSWLRANQLATNQYLVSDGAGPYYSSPSEVSPVRQWTPPAIQEISVDDYSTSRRALRPLSFSPTMEGTSAARDSCGSTSSRSDSSDCDSMVKAHSSHRNFSSRRCFLSKPIHPLSFPSEMPRRDATDSMSAGLSELDASTLQRDKHRLSSASGSIDLTDVSEPYESEVSNKSSIPSDTFRCGLCERFLSQRSPWSSRRIVRSGDMPVAGVLSCRHVFHAECLEQTTPKARRNDPPCPICSKVEDESSPDQRVFSKFFPRLRPFREDGPSRPWGCAQAGDCVQGALHAPSRNTMLSLNRNRIRKNLTLKGNQGKEFPGKLRKSGTFTSPLFIGSADHGAVGSPKTASSSMK